MDLQLDNFASFPLFHDIEVENLPTMLECLGYQLETYSKGAFIISLGFFKRYCKS